MEVATQPTTPKGAVQVKKIHEVCAKRKRHIERRLERARGGMKNRGGPEFAARRVRYEMSERVEAISCGGLGVVHELVHDVGLVDVLDQNLGLLKQYRPYHESDHVLNIAYNVLCGGQVLDDIELRRNDAGYLNALGARSIPDPTTAGDFCRRFDCKANWRLMSAINETRLGVWRRLGQEFVEQTARIDADGTMVPTQGACKQGMDLSHKGVWGYHPLLVSLANTGEPLFIVNRSGNRPSHEHAPEVFDRAIDLCRRAGFQDILLRGDTDFSLTAHFDRWTDLNVRFVFGYDSSQPMVSKAQAVDDDEYRELVRKADSIFEAKRRAKQPRVKDEIVFERGYYNITLETEDITEFEHKPSKARRAYRFVVLRKTLVEERGQICMGTKFRYFFYVTNDRDLACEDVIHEANARCQQENLIEQLKNGPRALRAPLNTLDSNWAYMLMSALAWSLKAWFALLLPIDPRWRNKHEQERENILRMDFRSFVHRLMLLPAQILRSGRRLFYRILSWRPDLGALLRLHESFS